MKEKTKEVRLAYRLAVLLAGLSLVCGILIYTAPSFALQLAGYLTHSTIGFSVKPFEPIGFVLGLLLWAAIGYASGWVLER